MTSRRPSILNRSSTQTQTELPTQEDQIRGYRQMARNRHQVARTTRRVFGRSNYNRTLETAVDPERQLEISRERRANLVPAEVLYSNNRSTARHRVYEHYSEQRILCVGENQINLRLCNEESYESLRNSGLQHIHLGIFMIRLHALHRRSAGTNALVVLRDTRWEDSRQIIATMEVDLSAGTQLVYTFPDMILSVNDFHNHVEVAIQTHGYDTWQGGESNLLITMALTGRLSNTSYMGFQYSVENVVDHLTTTGITAIPGERRSIEELEGMSWHLKPPEQTSVRVPSRVAVNERLNRSVSLRFERYRQTPQPPRYSVDQHDREVIRNDNLDEDEEHFIGICLQTPQEEHISYDVKMQTTILNPEYKKFGSQLVGEMNSQMMKLPQERMIQNQQEFLDEYLPQWDENLAIQKKESESKWENPFAAKSGENHNHTILQISKDIDDDGLPYPKFRNHTILHISKEENDDDDLPYPKFRNFKQMAAKIIKKHEEHAFPSSSSQQNQPTAINPHSECQSWGHHKIFNGGYGEYHNSQWTLPPAWTESGVMLVLPSDPGLWSEVISRWESITNNRLNNQTWSDNKAKLAFVENLLGESEKLMWQQRRTAYPGAYSALEAIADEPQNITSQVRQLILQLATKSGRLYFPSTTEKLFSKLPPSLSKKIEESFRAKHPGLSSGVLPAIKFTHTFVSEMCKDAALAKELRDLSLCSAIPIPEGHFAKDCRSKQGNIARSAVYQELDLDDNWDIVSADFDDSSVYSISIMRRILTKHNVMVQDTPIEETVFMAIEDIESDDDLEEEDDQFGHHAFMFHPGPPTKIARMVTEQSIVKPDKELQVKSKECDHENGVKTRSLTITILFISVGNTNHRHLKAINGPKCQLTSVPLCKKFTLSKTVNVKEIQPQNKKEEKTSTAMK
ncbi:hypothetical protein Tco_1283004 [Tanacetum coccineum]